MYKILFFILCAASLFGDPSDKIGYIYIGDHKNQINQSTWIYVKNALEYYKKERPSFIILELDTPGGELFTAQKISDALKQMDIQEDIPVVAYINNWAISAGAMLAYSCRTIVTSKDGSMGAAEPISGEGAKSSEKINSAVRADFANRAAFFDRNPLLAKAMVDVDMLLVYRKGQIIELSDENQILPDDEIITNKGKLLTLTADEMIKYKVANFLLSPVKLQSITLNEKEKGRWPASKELLMTLPEYKKFADGEVIAFQTDFRTQFFTILSNPIVTSLLILAVIICFYIELHTPGFGVAGSLGLLALFLVVLSSFAVQAASMLEVLILLAGIGLILLEIFVIPGFGITGILGIILALGGLIALLLPSLKEVSFDFDTKTLNAAGHFFVERLAWLAGTFLIGVIVIIFSSKFIRGKFARFTHLVLHDDQEGYIASGFEKEYIGKVGVAYSDLKPAGHIMVEGKYMQALSQSGYLDKGTKVEVVGGGGAHLIVKKIEEE